MSRHHDAHAGNATRRIASTLGRAIIQLLAGVCALSAPAAAQTVVTDDAHVNAAPKSTDANYGHHPDLLLSPGSPIFLKFDIRSGLPPSTPGTAVAKATVRLYLGNVTLPGSLDVSAVGDAWEEETITGKNAPPLGALLGISEPIVSDSRHHFIVVDVTSVVQQWLGDDGLGTNGLPNYGIALTAHGETSVTFDSKENSQTSHEPQLEIELLGSSTNTGITSVHADFPLSVSNGTTTPTISLGLVPVGHGGTGLSSAGAAGNFLRSTGAVWTAAPLTAADVPDLAGSYIRNAMAPQGPANFNIAGIGTANVLDATTQFNLGGSRILTNEGTNNLFAGIDAGASNTTGTANAFFGKNAGQANLTGTSNSFVGYNAGAGNTTGARNTFAGDAAGFVNAAGNDNAFFGFLAGFHNTAHSNSFFGSLAGADNTTGGGNSFFGMNAGVHNTTGTGNNFVGFLAGANNREGEGNSYFGNLAGVNATGSENVFLGAVAGLSTTTGGLNAFVGSFAGVNNTTGGGNAFFGRSSGLATTTGNANTFLGITAGVRNKTGSNNTLLGAGADVAADGLSFATAIGSLATVTTSNTVVLGRSADTVQVPGALNVSGTFGANILSASTQFNLGGSRVFSNAGISNLFVGTDAGAAHQSGFNNSFYGSAAGKLNADAGGNSFFGASAGENNTGGNQNSFFGAYAGWGNTTGNENAFFAAGFGNTTGSQNAYFGAQAGGSILAAGGGTGWNNSFFGWHAGFQQFSGANNAFFGAGTGQYSIGSSNAFFGAFAGLANTTGSSVTLVGAMADVGAGDLAFASAIGAGAVVNTSNTMVLGRNVDTVRVPGAFTVAGNIFVGSPGQGIILKSPDGARCGQISIDNAGNLSLVAIACP